MNFNNNRKIWEEKEKEYTGCNRYLNEEMKKLKEKSKKKTIIIISLIISQVIIIWKYLIIALF